MRPRRLRWTKHEPRRYGFVTLSDMVAECFGRDHRLTPCRYYILISSLGDPGERPLTLRFRKVPNLRAREARWIQEHYLVGVPQETHSYYGPLNANPPIGYHSKHHDLPLAPWNQLPKIRSAAPQPYNNSLAYHTWWAQLLYKFMFDPRIDLFPRIVPFERGNIVLDAAVNLTSGLSKHLGRQRRGRHRRLDSTASGIAKAPSPI